MEGVAWVAFTCGALSAAGCVLTSLAFGRVVRPKSPTSRLLVALTLADFGQAVFFMLSPLQLQRKPSSLACTFSAGFGMFTATASFLWTLCIGGFVFWVAAAPSEAMASLPLRASAVLFSHIVAWGYPTLFLGALFAAHPEMEFYDPDVPWCFVPKSHPFWRLASVYFPLLACWLGTSVLYCAARVKLKARRFASADQHYAKFIAIPLGFAVLRVWGTVYRLVQLSDDSPDATWLLYLTVIGDPLQGAYNCAVFVLASPSVRSSLWNWIRCKGLPPPSSSASSAASPGTRTRRRTSSAAPGSPLLGGSRSASLSPKLSLGYRVITPPTKPTTQSPDIP